MFDNQVVLEAMRVICSDGLTSAQTQGFIDGSVVTDVSSGPAPRQQLLSITDLTHLALCGGAPWSPARHPTTGTMTGPEPGCLINLPADMNTDPKTGTITLDPKDSVWSLEHLDPRFNYDFSHLKDTEKYYRGGEEYERPCGWQRFGLKVLDKYEDNTWLGNTRRETESVKGEWPVSYHGTQEQYVKAITEENYTAGTGALYGKGIYSTPDFEIAKTYATRFPCNGHYYKVIMQNRINPKYREICKGVTDYWLVRIEDETEAREIVKKAIRPYGLLLIEV